MTKKATKPQGLTDAIKKKFLADIKDSSKNPTIHLAAAMHRLSEWAASGHFPKGMTYEGLKWMYDQLAKECHRRDPKSKAGGNFPAEGSGRDAEPVSPGEPLADEEESERCQALTSALGSAGEEREAEEQESAEHASGELNFTEQVPAAFRACEMLAIEVDERGERAKENEDTRRFEVSFSSDTPVAGRFGDAEVLDHGAGIDLSRLNSGAPVLLDHDPHKQIGVVEHAWSDGHKGRARIRFGKGQQASEIYQDVKDGIRRNLSVGYNHDTPMPMQDAQGRDIQLIRKWQPAEISVVSIPADHTVGVGRSAQKPRAGETTTTAAAAETAAKPATEVATPETSIRDTKMSEENHDAVVKDERSRVSQINRLAGKFETQGLKAARELASAAIDAGDSPAVYSEKAFAELEKTNIAAARQDRDLGLTEKEKREFSFVRAIRASLPKASKADREAGAFEMEVSDAYRAKHTNARGTFSVPYEVLTTRAVLTGSADTVATNLLPQDFIEYLYANMVVAKCGAMRLDGLVGNVDIPSLSGAQTAHWLATDSTALTESEPTISKISLSPNTVTGYAKYTRQLLAQSTPAIEGIVRNDMAMQLAEAIDTAAINGSGSSGQPTGILNTSGITTVALGTNGGAPTYASLVNLIGALSKNNALRGSLNFLINGEGFETLSTTARIGSTYPVYILQEPGDRFYGYPVHQSQNVPNNLSKGTASGTLSAVVFGNFQDLILASWGGLDILVDPYTNAASNEVTIYGYQMVDVGVRHAVSFSAIVDMITT